MPIYNVKPQLNNGGGGKLYMHSIIAYTNDNGGYGFCCNIISTSNEAIDTPNKLKIIF